MKIRCKICQESHKATGDNFPRVFQENRKIFQGSGNRRKSLGTQMVPVGYACKKCVTKHERMQIVKQYNIKPLPGQRLIEAIRKKVGELLTVKEKEA